MDYINQLKEGNSVKVKIGEFVQEHLENIRQYCEQKPEELQNLMDRKYTKEMLGLEATYPFLKLESEADPKRYWSKVLKINGQKYKACSQFGGSDIKNGQTRSEREGLQFLSYLKKKNLLLERYKNKIVKFIVGKSLTDLDIEVDTSVKILKNDLYKNIVFYGVPGVGKTHNTKKLISLVESGKGEKEIFDTIKRNDFAQTDISELESRVSFITFHQSFGYEDFIEGFRPNENGQIELVDGVFKRLCEKARDDKAKNYYLVIDEINRGNISKIFGELITLIEEDKRDTYEVTLPYSKEKFSVPSNLYIIGTMNSTDKSIALIDVALRRRFTFLKMEPNAELIKYGKAKKIFEALNEKLEVKLGTEHIIGHSYFMNVENEDDLKFVLEYKIKPLLEEYFYGDNDGLDEILSVIM